MLVTSHRFHELHCLRIWWPECAEGVASRLSLAPIVTVMHCPAIVAEALKPYAFAHRRYYNVLVDLSRPEEELWHGIHSRIRRYIKQAGSMGCRILVNEETERALRVINGLIERKKFRRRLSLPEWQRECAHGDVFLVKHDDHVVAAQLVLVDRPVRARGIFGGTIDPQNARLRHIVGPLHRYLFWSLFTRYKAEGIRWYDFGGAERDGASAWSPVAQFKLGFGGRLVEEHTLHLAGNPALRSILRTAADVASHWRGWSSGRQ